MKLKLRNNQTGEVKEIQDYEAPQYGLDSKYVATKVAEKQKATTEAVGAMQTAVQDQLTKDPKANRRGLIYTWIQENGPYFDALGVDGDTLWDIHNKTPEPGGTQSGQTGQTATPQEGSGILGRIAEAYKQTPKEPTWPFGSNLPGSNILKFLSFLKG